VEEEITDRESLENNGLASKKHSLNPDT